MTMPRLMLCYAFTLAWVLTTVLPTSVMPAAVAQTTRPATQPATLENHIDRLFAAAVTADGLVRYEVVQANRRTLDTLVNHIGKPQKFASKQHELAFYINAYNLMVLQQILVNAPVEQVIKVDGFFDKTKHRVNGQAVTLNELEKGWIASFGDPRFHAAVVCAAISCPPLRAEAYQGETLDEQLEDNTRRWLADPTKNTVRRGSLVLSKIFEWYKGDFAGKPYAGVHGFIKAHGPRNSALVHAAGQGARITYGEYDWTINQAPTQ